MNNDNEYISPWGVKPQQPTFTEMQIALMEGGHSLEESNKKFSFLKELLSANNRQSST